MSYLLHAGVHGVDLVLVQLGRQGREVEEPVPAPADEESSHHIAEQDVAHPSSRVLLGMGNIMISRVILDNNIIII